MWPAQRWDAGTPGTSSSPSNTLENRLRSRWETTADYPSWFCIVDEIIKTTGSNFDLSFCSFIISSATSWTISHHQAMNVRFLLHSRVVFKCFLSVKPLNSSSPPLDLPGNLISHIFRENEVCREAEWERYFCFENIEVPEIYSGPHLTFPLTVEQAVGLVEAFRNKKVGEQQRFTNQCPMWSP